MSGVEEVAKDIPPDEENNDDVSEVKKDEVEESSVKTSSDSESGSLTGSWTLVEKEDEESGKKLETDTENGGSSIEVLDKKNGEEKQEETDSDSIETISDDEILLATSSTVSYCYIPAADQVESGTTESLVSLESTASVASDGIPINSGDQREDPQYEWSNEGEREIPEDDADDDINQEEADTIEEEEEHEERILDPGEPGYDLDDDGLPGEPLPPLAQEVELYPSQELDPGYQVIKKEKNYKHDKNIKVDHFLTAILVLALALVVGLGIGHFLGLSERLEVQEMYENLQEERLDVLQEDLVSCIEGEEGQGGDDQDLDDKVIKQLWEENQELRDQVHQLRTDNPQGDDAMAVILRDRINDLLTANADLERQVARLRYVEAARGAAESVETLDKLRKTRDTLNDIVTENDQLKIEVGKSRYGEHSSVDTVQEERDQLILENNALKSRIIELEKGCSKSSGNTNIYETIQSAFEMLQQNPFKDEFPHPWPTKRTDELNTQGTDSEFIQHDDDVDDDDDEVKNESLDDFSKYLERLASIGKTMMSKDGKVDLSQMENFMNGLKSDMHEKLEHVEAVAKKDLETIYAKFDELKSFIVSSPVHENLKASHIASTKLLKSLLGYVKGLSEASEDAAESDDWLNIFNKEHQKVQDHLDRSWSEIKNKWNKIVSNEEMESDDDDRDDDKDERRKAYKAHSEDDDDDERERKNFKKDHHKKRRWSGDDDDEGYHSHDENRKYQERKHYKKQDKKESHDDMKRNSTTINWEEKRSMEREKQRKEHERSDWIFERAKQRKDIRYEETRGDWYFERKRDNRDYDDSKHCYKGNCKNQDKGEKYLRKENKYSEKNSKSNKDKGDTKHSFNEEAKYVERHYNDRKYTR